MAAEVDLDRVFQATTEKELEQLIDELSKEEIEIQNQIETALLRVPDLTRAYENAISSMPELDILENEVNHIDKKIRYTAELADSVSSKVRTLDLARQRVQSTAKRVDDILDLQSCTAGIQTSMRNEEYENAAAHIHRYLKIDTAALLGGSDNSNDATLVQSFSLLKDAEKRLKRIVSTKFDEALTRNDTASIERFFKLFPLLHEHELGLRKYSLYLRSQISEAAEKRMQKLNAIIKADEERTLQRDKQQSAALFADIINQLVEHVAKLIDLHQPIVETFYGPGHLLTLVKFIQEECDAQAETLLEKHERVRRLKSRSQTLDQVQRRSTTSAALSTSTASGGGGSRRHHHQASINLAIDAREIDLLLSEAALLNTRVTMYFQLVRRRCAADIDNSRNSEENNDSVIKSKLTQLVMLCQQCRLAQLLQDIITSYMIMEEFFMRQTFLKAINVRVVPQILQQTSGRASKSLAPAVVSNSTAKEPKSKQQTSATNNQKVLTTQQIDDIFFIFRKCIARALSSHHVDAVCAILNYTTTLLVHELAPFLLDKCNDCEFVRPSTQFSAASSAAVSTASALISSTIYDSMMTPNTATSAVVGAVAGASSGIGGIGGGGGASGSVAGILLDDEQQVDAINEFFAVVNDADVCCRYIESLHAALSHDASAKLGASISDAECQKLETALGEMRSAPRQHFQQVLTHAFDVLLRKTRLKALIKPLVESSFAYAVKHNCTSEAEFAAYEADNAFLRAFAAQYEQLLSLYVPCLTPHNAELLIGAYCDELVEQLQRRVLKTKFSRLGAVLFDKEVRTLMLVVTSAKISSTANSAADGSSSSVTGTTTSTTTTTTTGAGMWALRDKFLRLSQMANILNFDSLTDVAEYYTPPPPAASSAQQRLNRTLSGEPAIASGGGGGLSQYVWLLNPVEVRALLACRTDFSTEDIKKLKF